jgi:uncharacterized membrane protein
MLEDRKRNLVLPQSSKTLVLIGWGALLSGWILMPIGPLIALIIASISKDKHSDAASYSHFHKIAFVFYISLTLACFAGLVAMLGNSASSIIFVVMPLMIITSVYCSFCAIKGMINASDNKGYF